VSLDSGSGPAVTFGLFDWVDSDGVREPGQLYRERLDLLVDAEFQGFDIYHLAEHHSTPLGLVPSPSVFLAAAAMRTTRIRLCPLVYVLPLYQPTRLAEEIAMLDQLSGGRLEIGFGKGGNPYELLAYGIERGDAQRRYDEVLDSVMRTLESGTIDAPGTTADGTELPIRTRQAPYPPLWYPSSNPQSVPLLGKRGINTILGFSFRSPTIEVTRLRRDEYFDAVADAPRRRGDGGVLRAVHHIVATPRRRPFHRAAGLRPRHRRGPRDRRLSRHRTGAAHRNAAGIRMQPLRRRIRIRLAELRGGTLVARTIR